MKVISNPQEALTYVQRLGFSPAGSIHHQQVCLCALCRALENAAGGYPYQVRFHRHVSGEDVSFPWLGRFTVRGEHVIATVRASEVSS